VVTVSAFFSFFALTRNKDPLFAFHNGFFALATVLAAERWNIRNIHLALIEKLGRVIKVWIIARRHLSGLSLDESICGNQHDFSSLYTTIRKS
jgi:hypothetical protein